MPIHTSSKNLLVNLQICRALAAVLVVIGHALQDSGAIAVQLGIPAMQSSLNWGCGVDIFFVISGFIMVHVAGDDFGIPGAPGRFFTKRLARIVPLYWSVTTALIVGALVAPSLLNVPLGNFQNIVASYLFIPDWRPDHSVMRPVMALGWTLNYEMLFYAAFAAAMFLGLRRGIAVLTVGFVAAIAVRLAFNIKQDQLAYWTDPIVLEFLYGVYIALAWRAGWRLALPWALVLGGFGFGLATGLMPEPFGLTEDVNFLCHGLPAGMLVAAVTLGPGLTNSPATRFGLLLGDASFALYLVHPFVIRPLRFVWLKLGGGALPLLAYVAFCVAIAIGAALLLHWCVEKPLARLVKPRSMHNSLAARHGPQPLPAGE